MKCQFGYRKVRYRGIAKNGAQVFSLLALANLYLARGRLASACTQAGAERPHAPTSRRRMSLRKARSHASDDHRTALLRGSLSNVPRSALPSVGSVHVNPDD